MADWDRDNGTGWIIGEGQVGNLHNLKPCMSNNQMCPSGASEATCDRQTGLPTSELGTMRSGIG